MAAHLNKNYLLMKVNYSNENPNKSFLKAYPKVPAYPHFFVLDSHGKFLHSQGTAELEEGRGYDEKVFLAFLTKWQPKAKKDAEKVLAAGLRRARGEKKKVLVHLGAPT